MVALKQDRETNGNQVAKTTDLELNDRMSTKYSKFQESPARIQQDRLHTAALQDSNRQQSHISILSNGSHVTRASQSESNMQVT